LDKQSLALPTLLQVVLVINQILWQYASVISRLNQLPVCGRPDSCAGWIRADARQLPDYPARYRHQGNLLPGLANGLTDATNSQSSYGGKQPKLSRAILNEQNITLIALDTFADSKPLSSLARRP
jgi:hypothetical protein